MKNTERQPNTAVSAPPSTGPATCPMAPLAAQIATVRARTWRSRYASASRASIDGRVSAAPIENIAQRATGQQQAREHDGVAAADPPQAGDIAAEIVLDRRQRDVHHRGVENDHKKTDGGNA